MTMPRRSWILVFGACSMVLVCASAYGASNEIAKATLSGKSTNLTVHSAELEPFGLDNGTSKEERLQFYKEGNMSVGFNEDGDPAVGTRF